MKARFLLFLILLFGMFSCKGPGVSTGDYAVIPVDLKDKGVMTDEPMFDDFDYLMLETSDSSLLGEVAQTILSEDRIFIYTMFPTGSVKVFDKSGRYLYSLHRGRGHGELLYPNSIALDRNARQLLVLDKYDAVVRYDLDGNFIDKQTYAGMPNFYFERLGDGMLFFNPNITGSTQMWLTYCDSTGHRSEFLPRVGKFRLFIMQGGCFTRTDDGGILVNTLGYDTVYMARPDGTVKPRFVFDFGSRGIGARLESFVDHKD